jgi:hypothetical protein
LPLAAAAGALALELPEDESLELEEEPLELEEEPLELEEEPLELEEPPSFLVELYRSEYQPPPLRTKLERLTTLFSVPWAPHAVQASGVGSLTFCRTSMIFSQLWQEYS